MGNKGKGLFVRAGVPGFMAEGALPAADILTPNLFELELLTGLKPRGLQAVRDAAATLLARGPKVVLVRSEEHTSELQSLMRISSAVFCVKKKKTDIKHHTKHIQ